MRKIISFILGTIVALNLSVSVANAAANEVRVAFFLEWATPNQEDKVKKAFDKALGVPVKWTDFKTGGVPNPDYDSEDINFVDQKTEFTEDVFIYSDAYAQSFNGVEISVVGSTLTFTVAGIGSTSLTLS